ncbi:P-loop containing nucleoside triphosphate hydrolase protein [Sporodiniella umbellata]|nr:P-loop containing nucleoside triphosphate hydrolase protein [Sporodiniella umbellata]
MSFLWSFGAKKEQPQPAQPSSGLQQQQLPPVKAMSHAFKKGVHYNMKVILRGDVMTGKSSLFERLQGMEFKEDYTSTPEIQVGNILWPYKDSQDIIKIEIWDVIDKANQMKSEGIKLEHHVPQPMGLDATTVHVYRNTHAAIFLFDVTKPWTFDYVKQELAHVPESVSVLVLGNFADKENRTISLDQIHHVLYEHNQVRIEKNAIHPNLIRYAETSMKSGLGLKYIYDYLGVPFLQLMMETLRKQLEIKQVEIVDLLESLDTNEDVPEVMQRRRGQDNFDQPSEPRLEHVELAAAWDKELEEIAADHAVLPNTPPPPTSPVKSNSHVPLPKENSVQFDTGEELADDWFGEVEEEQAKIESEPEEPSNPMVAGDEDVQVDYYTTVKAKPEPVHYQSMFKEEVWNQRNTVASESEEEEEEPAVTFSGEYEEIGGEDNPWSKEDHWPSQQEKTTTTEMKKSSKKKHKKKKNSSQVRK